ncbi:MAG: TetR/AcrR family transcriptional regulator [Streptosporangiaceae bacterium]
MNRSTRAGESASPPGAAPAPRRRRQRADARQSIAAILRAAAEALNADPGASVEDIAMTAGVTRQTVYAHFPSREALIEAVTERATAEVAAAFETAGLDDAPPPVALTRLLDTGWRVAARYPFLWYLPSVSPGQDRDRHGPVLDRMLAIIERGQETGDFDRALSPSWLLAAALAVGRAAEDEVKAGRMTIDEASHAVHHSYLRLFGIQDPTPG